MRWAALLALVPLMACGAGDDADAAPAQGTGSTRSYDLRDFTAVQLAGSDDVDVRVGGDFSVRAEGDPAILDKLRISKKGDRLIVSRDWTTARGEARIHVTLPVLTAVALNGSGDLSVDRVRTQRFEAALAGSGDLRLAQVEAGDLSLSIAGSGDIAAAGAAQTLRVSIAGSGDLSAGSLVATRAEVRVAGSGDVRATVRGPATVSSVGSGDVDLGPDARCTVRKAGSGEVRCGG
ncbi:hypothetical protein J2Y58_002385 [Sphingomonas sp. BE138]|uniref:head GIN domain-containing protein n=1 Tax=Sphingomonas sp. BE138 TaxID=2817845 RepID=UPI002862D823|nr:head GIN domain-containing protein [Sphingomonas sp. BE138]MDR6789016.1 hypothetical protein [Sphingomonas sp. BE138]